MDPSEIIAELESYREFRGGWDGYEAAAPIPSAIDDAVSFIRRTGMGYVFEPTLHADGSVLLEMIADAGSLKFRGDKTIIFALVGQPPFTVPLVPPWLDQSEVHAQQTNEETRVRPAADRVSEP